MYQNKIIPEISEYISGMQIISSHCHHLPDENFADMGLFSVLEKGYCQWMEPTPEANRGAVEEYIFKMRANTYFRWLQQSFKKLYGVEMSAETYIELDEKIKAANADSNYHLKLLRDTCNYKYNVLDSYWAPGTNNNHPEIFKHTYRCDTFMNAFDYDLKTVYGLSAYDFAMSKDETKDFESFVQNTLSSVRKAKIAGASALKFGIAYFQSLDIEKVSHQKAAKAFLNPDATEEQIKNFRDYMVFRIVELAGELDIPVLIHTGLGMLNKSNAISLRVLIEENPDVRFLLFHGGFPWTDDVLALLHNFKNVIADFNWLPLVCTNKAIEFIINALETGGAHRLCWGCDTWTSEESYGARLAMEHALGVALSHMVNDGAFDVEYAKYVATRILYENPKEIFKIT